MQAKPVAIIGMGAIFPKALNLKDFWRLILNGRDAITDVPDSHWSPDEYFNADRSLADHLYCKRGGFLEPYDFDPAEFGIPPNNLDATDTSQLLGLVAASMALENAGYGKNAEFDRERASVVLGVTGTQELTIPLSSRLSHPRWRKAMQVAGIDEHTAEQVMSLLSKSYVEWQENSFPGLLGNVVAGRISNRLDLRGTNCVVDAACASSLGALHLALLELESGKSDMVVSGGVDTLNDVFMHMCFCKTGVLSPTGDIRPFAGDADGTVLGEGIGMLVLKRLEDAERDKDTIYAVIKGLGSSSDGKSQSIYAPNAKGQERALRNAYAAAGIEPASVELIEGHGTGTLVGDKVEVSALQEVFAGVKPKHTAIGSIKALVGHTKSAAGSAGLIKAALALHNKVLPPSVKITAPNPILNETDSPFYLNAEPRPWVKNNKHPRRSGVSAFGFGGSNFHAVLEEYKPHKKHISWDNTTQILAFSADTIDALQQSIQAFNALKLTSLDAELAWQAMQTRKQFKNTDEWRLLVIIDETTDIAASLDKAQTICSQGMPQSADNIFFGQGKAEGALAFAFPGQGSQYPHMCVNYATRFPQVLAALETFNGYYDSHNDEKLLSDYIYPPAAFSNADYKAQMAELTQTRVAQPALGAISWGLADVLTYFGVKPQFTIGHSFGELSALNTAGWLNTSDFPKMSVIRGAVVAEDCDENPDGGMLAVYSDAETVEAFLATNKLNVCIANINAPKQTILSGLLADIKTAAELLQKTGIKSTPLKVSGAFHSKFVTKARDAFADKTNICNVRPTDIQVISNLTGAAYPHDEAKAKTILADQIKNPVNFMPGVQTLYAKGVRTFIEVGPKTVLSNLIGAILPDKDIDILSLDQSRGHNHLHDLAVTLCHLAAQGRAVKLDLWEDAVTKPRTKIMHVPLLGANFGPKGVNGNDYTPDPDRGAAKKPVQPAPPPAAIAKSGSNTLKPQAATAMQTYKQPEQTDSKIMNNNNNLNIIEQSLSAIRQLQEQVTRAHEKFLDTQAEANRTMQNMLTVLAGGVPAAPQIAAVPTPVVTQPVPQQVLNSTAAIAKPNEPTVSFTTTPVQQQTPNIAPVQPPVAPTPPSAGNNIAAELLAVVSELTGYPEDMLQLDMQIESDLGIDSIKRVEILSTLEERLPNLPATDPEEMAALKTLGEIVAVFGNGSVDAATQPQRVKTQTVQTVTSSNADITAELLTVVSELTGYPQDMLQLDMQIESDLGIDSIKRVEILSTLEERLPNLPQTDPEEMAALKTLGEIAAVFSAGAPVAASINIATTPAAVNDINASLLSIVSELTGYPQDMLQLDMQIESDLGIDSIKRVEILSTLEERIPNLPQTDPEEMAALKTLGEIAAKLTAGNNKAAETVTSKTPESVTIPKPTATGVVPQRRVVKIVETAVLTQLPQFNADSPVVLTGANIALLEALSKKLIALGAKTVILDKTSVLKQQFETIQGLIIMSDSTATDDGTDLKLNFAVLRHLGKALLSSAKPFVVGISSLDSAFGFKHTQKINAASAGLAGLLKTINIEWPQCSCRMVDIDPAWHDFTNIADAVLAEVYLADGLETGLGAGKRLKLDLELTDLPELDAKSFGAKDLFVISGGARGVTAQAAIALSKAFKPKLALLGRSPSPFQEPVWLDGLTDNGAIKKAIIANDFKDATPTPKEVEAKFKHYMANREINANLNAMRKLGADAQYYSVDILDKKALTTAFTDIKADLGSITALVHGAGVLEDKLLLEKTDEQFAKVYTTKVTGMLNLLEACKNENLRALALFSSVTARMGNKGQSDYAAANEILNKTAQNMALEHKDMKVVSFNWGPWDGGMVSPLLKKEFAELKVDLVDMQGGAEAFVRELAGHETAVEVVFGSGFEALLPKIDYDTQKADNPTDDFETKKATPTADLHHLFDLEVTPQTFPVLNAHIIDGNYVMPFAVSLELMAHAAMHENPGLKLAAIKNARVFKGLVLPQNNPKVEIGLYAGKAMLNAAGFAEVFVELKARQNGKSYTVAGAVIGLAGTLAKTGDKAPAQPNKSYALSAKDVYDQVLFHGAMLQGINDISICDVNGADAMAACLNKPQDIMAHPLRSNLLTDPLALDCAFQLASLWCFENHKTVSLPSDFANLQIYGKFTAGKAVRIVLKVTSVKGQIMKGDLKFCEGERVIAEITGFSAVMNQSLNTAFKPNLKYAV